MGGAVAAIGMLLRGSAPSLGPAGVGLLVLVAADIVTKFNLLPRG
jgi:hypothetical protein